MGNTNSFKASVFRITWSLLKLMHRPVHLFHTPCVVSLQSLEWREVGLKLSYLFISFKPHWCDQHLHFWNADIDFYTPLSLYIEVFTLYLARKLCKMSTWMYSVSCSPFLEESHLSDTRPVMENSHFMALPQSHSPQDFVPLGWWLCTWPA